MVERLDRRAMEEGIAKCGMPVVAEDVDARCSHLRRGWYWGSQEFAGKLRKLTDKLIKDRTKLSRAYRKAPQVRAHSEEQAEGWLSMTLAHNLLLLLEERLVREEGGRDEVEEKKQIGRTYPTRQKPGKPEIMKVVEIVRNFINSAVTRATQRTQRFIRWVRVRIYKRVPWSESVARLRELWTLPT
jgi:hypothetical protein